MTLHGFSPFYMQLFFIRFENNETYKDERKHHGTVDKSPSKQYVCVTDGKCLHCAKNWTHTPSASGSYISQASRLAGLDEKYFLVNPYY